MGERNGEEGLDLGAKGVAKDPDGKDGADTGGASVDAAQAGEVPVADGVLPDAVRGGPGQAAEVESDSGRSSLIDRIPKDKLGLGRGRKLGSKGNGGIKGAQRDLRMAARRLAHTDTAETRKEIRRHLEVISLLYAAKATDGAEFRQSASLAVDLSGFKIEQHEKAKIRAKKAEAKSAKKAISASRAAEMADIPKEQVF